MANKNYGDIRNEYHDLLEKSKVATISATVKHVINKLYSQKSWGAGREVNAIIVDDEVGVVFVEVTDDIVQILKSDLIEIEKIIAKDLNDKYGHTKVITCNNYM